MWAQLVENSHRSKNSLTPWKFCLVVCGFSDNNREPSHNASIIDITSWRITHNQEKYEIILYIFFLEIGHVYKYSMYSLEIKVFVV